MAGRMDVPATAGQLHPRRDLIRVIWGRHVR
jgi:hypothetical protein